MTWRDELEVGDKVKYNFGGTYTIKVNYIMAEVVKVTKTQITVDANGVRRRFSKLNGDEIGVEDYGIWHRKPHIKEAD